MSIAKLFDYIIIKLSNDTLSNLESDMQFGFKDNHSTTMCSLKYKDIIGHYLTNGSTMYSSLLDVTKAFDRIHFESYLVFY